MISLIEAAKPAEKTDNDDKDEDMKEAPSEASTTSSTMTAATKSTASPTEEQAAKKISLPNLKKLSDEDCSTLLHACVNLIGLPVDAYALNAILRLLLRLTRNFDYAVTFAQMGGVKMLLDLTQASSFSGFFSLVSDFDTDLGSLNETLTVWKF